MKQTPHDMEKEIYKANAKWIYYSEIVTEKLPNPVMVLVIL